MRMCRMFQVFGNQLVIGTLADSAVSSILNESATIGDGATGKNFISMAVYQFYFLIRWGFRVTLRVLQAPMADARLCIRMQFRCVGIAVRKQCWLISVHPIIHHAYSEGISEEK